MSNSLKAVAVSTTKPDLFSFCSWWQTEAANFLVMEVFSVTGRQIPEYLRAMPHLLDKIR